MRRNDFDIHDIGDVLILILAIIIFLPILFGLFTGGVYICLLLVKYFFIALKAGMLFKASAYLTGLFIIIGSCGGAF